MKFFSLLSVLVITLFFSTSSFAQKMTAQEVVTKHLESIGSKEKLASVKNRIMLGDIQFKLQGSATPLTGKAVIASSDVKSLWGMNFNSNNYPQERFGYDGKSPKIGFTTPGNRSILGLFLFSFPEILRDGLLGGSLTSSWALLYAETRNPKLSFEGEKKIDGKDAYVLSYSPKTGSDISIKMYFDKSNFHHLRTEYNRVVGAGIGTGGVDSSTAQGERRYKMVEDFSDYKDAGGLMLPSSYKLFYSYFSNAAVRISREQNREAEWKFSITNFSYNQPLDENTFNIPIN